MLSEETKLTDITTLKFNLSLGRVDHQAVNGDVAQAVPVADRLVSSGQITDLWRRAVNRGHIGATLRPLPDKR